MNARDLALIELDSKSLPDWPAQTMRPRRAPRQAVPIDPRDRSLADQITIGVVKNLLQLQFWIEHYADRPLKKIDPLLQKILAIGLYQLRYLDRIPSSAAVDESVQQCRRFGRTHSTGFVNAILRRSMRQPAPLAPMPIALSHPPELLDRLKSLLGEEPAVQFAHHNNRQPPLIVRIFSSADSKQLLEPGLALSPHQQTGMYVVANATHSILADWSRRGIAQVQDPTSALVVQQCDIQPGQKILDRCCGMGTKTLQLHEHLEKTGQIYAMDPNPIRCQALRDLLAARAIDNVGVVQSEWIKGLEKILPTPFDRILVDAPCSNSGVLARRPEARYHQNPQSLHSLAKLQMNILNDSAPHVAPDGLLIYSTCSIWPEENQNQTAQFLTTHPDFILLKELTTLPSLTPDPTHYRDGGFYAVLQRRTGNPG
jgi:16S rRNA (cytosine967-C5)-methyltransferase